MTEELNEELAISESETIKLFSSRKLIISKRIRPTRPIQVQVTRTNKMNLNQSLAEGSVSHDEAK